MGGGADEDESEGARSYLKRFSPLEFTMQKKLRKLAITMLEDDNGISENAFVALHELAEVTQTPFDDISRRIDATDGRFYLESDHGLKP